LTSVIYGNNSTSEPVSLNIGELINGATNLKKIQDAEIMKYSIRYFCSMITDYIITLVTLRTVLYFEDKKR